GPVRDRLVDFLADWMTTLEAAIKDAQREGAIEKREDPAQLAFELEAFLLLANTEFALAQGADPVKAGRRAIERRLEAATTSRPSGGGRTAQPPAAHQVTMRPAPGRDPAG